jgi:integral membrane protein (TIGR01906 family)
VHTWSGRLAGIGIGAATAIVIIAVAILPFLSPAWVAFEQDRSQAAAWTGFSQGDLRTVTDSILHDLVIGPPAFDVALGGQPVLEAREQAHMRDVRNVFAGFYLVALIAAAGLIIASRRRDRRATWRGVRTGALALVAGVVVLGVVALVAFDQLFEAFHEVFFPAGSYLFDARTDHLVQLFPFEFWQETAIVVGVVIIGIALVVAWIAGRRAARAAEPSAGRAGVAVIPEAGA